MLEETTITPWSLCFFLHKNAPVVLAKLEFLSPFSSIPGKSAMQRFKEKEGGGLAIEPICFPSAYTFFTKQTTFSTRKTEHKEFFMGSAPSLSSGNLCRAIPGERIAPLLFTLLVWFPN